MCAARARPSVLRFGGGLTLTNCAIMGDMEKEKSFQSVKTSLLEMKDGGGRDTEKDLFNSIIAKWLGGFFLCWYVFGCLNVHLAICTN